ncbi:hypothetical protein LCGC14_2412220 [marine sediment metagenome]|uniref:Uncharacterized protein n=1 Tax=marine sediment metagenome TaxID=412755 RepID=A0A0F9BS50_9ZZZZ
MSRVKKDQIQKIRVWCTKCDKDLENQGVALDYPEDGTFYKCPKCNYRIVILKELGGEKTGSNGYKSSSSEMAIKPMKTDSKPPSIASSASHTDKICKDCDYIDGTSWCKHHRENIDANNNWCHDFKPKEKEPTEAEIEPELLEKLWVDGIRIVIRRKAPNHTLVEKEDFFLIQEAIESILDFVDTTLKLDPAIDLLHSQREAYELLRNLQKKIKEKYQVS